ncbi:MAG: MFS transporter [Streptosporangiales bacterium]|nr:MFS transporter [Streptosporangiales bacterium]
MTEERPELQPGQLSHRQILVVIVGLMLGMLVSALSQTSVSTALPTIVGELGGQDKLSWVVSVNLLTATAFMPLWGKLSDLYGRKALFQAAIVVFLIGSAASGLSQTIVQLIGFRAVQGLGMGGLIALSQTIIGDVVTPRQRGRYQGYMGATFGVATVAGPLIGGFLVDQLSWRWTFFVGIPVGIAALLVTERSLRLPFQRRPRRIDWAGAGLIVTGTGLILLVLSLAGTEFAWSSWWTYGLGGSGLLVLLLAAAVERRVAEPILPPRLFRSRTVTLVNFAGFVVGVAMFGAIIYLPQYLQIVKGQSPTASGLLTVPFMVGMLSMTIFSGQVIARTGRYKIFPVTGLALLAVGLFLLSRLGIETSLPAAGASMMVTGLGVGSVIQVLVTIVQSAVGRADMGAATSGAQFFRSMGGALGVALCGAILTNRVGELLPAKLAASGVQPSVLHGTGTREMLGSPDQIAQLPAPVHQAVLESFAAGLHTMFLAIIPFALVGFALMLFLRERPLRSS